MRALFLLTTAVVCIGAIPGAASAAGEADQDQTQGPEQPADNLATDDIIVTAQLRAQLLQEVPAAVTALTGLTLERAAITSVTDLQASVPSLNTVVSNRPASGTIFSLRGIGTFGNDPGLEGAVGFAVDGVYRSRSGTGLGDLVDIERIEVLRGPQGTLFGKNTTAGIISVVTRRPTNEFGGFAEITGGNYNLVRLRGGVNVPVVEDQLAFRVAGGYNNRDGFLRDVANGATYNDRNRWNIVGKALYTPTPNLSLYIIADYSKQDETCCQSVRLSNADAPYIQVLADLAANRGARYPVTPTPFRFETSANAPITSRNEDVGISAELNWDLGGTRLVSITSYRDFREDLEADVDFTGADLFHSRLGFGLKVFSQELRFQGNIDGLAQGLDWIVGGYYSKEKIKYTENVDFRGDLQPFFTSLSAGLAGLYPAQVDAMGANSRQNYESFAIFTHNILSVTEDLRLTGGLRYTNDRKDAVSNPFYNNPPANLPLAGLGVPFVPYQGYSLDYSDSAVTGTFIVDYKLADDVMAYASYSHGYKGGGFALYREAAGRIYLNNPICSASQTVAYNPPTIYACDMIDPRFKPETVNAYELGIRSQFLDRRLTINLTGFLADYSELQLSTFNGLNFVLQNAGSARTKGFELEAGFIAARGLKFGANISYTDARFGDEVPSLIGGEPPVGGQSVSNAPLWSGSLSADYSYDIGEAGNLFARAEYYFVSSFFTGTRVATDGQELRLDGYQLVNLNLGFQGDRGLQVSGYCRNCFDSRYATAVFSSVAQAGSKDQFLGSPREWGITLRKDF